MPKRLAPHLRPLDSREEKLDILLEHFREAQASTGRAEIGDGSSPNGAESKELRYDVTWTASYQELDRVLHRMVALISWGQCSPLFKTRFIHLRDWYLNAAPRRVPVMRMGKRGRVYQQTDQHGPKFEVEKWRGGAEPAIVMQGLVWVSLDFIGEPDLGELESKLAA